MITVSAASFFVLCLTQLTTSLAGPTLSSCKIVEVSPTAADGKLVRVGCGDKTVLVDLLEGGSYSTLKVIGEHGRGLLSVEYFKDSNDMFIIIDGEQFDVKDDSKKNEESVKFRQLLEDPEFEFFSDAARLIHDELQLKGWESPAVMFLYRMGIAAEGYNMKMNKRSSTGEKRYFGGDNVDPKTYDYHGPNPSMQCTYNGWSDPSMDSLIKDECHGVCGKTCTSCWDWVCGDCCIHTGCKRHDEFCSSGYLSKDCLSCRGVLWDTITDVPLDC